MATHATLGDIAKTIQQMKDDGMTLQSVQHVVVQVYADEIAAERELRERLKKKEG